MKYKIDFLLLSKGIIMYLVFWAFFFIITKNSTIILLSLFLCFLVIYDCVLKLNEMLLSIQRLDDLHYEIKVIKKFSKKEFRVKARDIVFKFEKRRFGRGFMKDFFSIYDQDKLICSIRVASDGWSRNTLQKITILSKKVCKAKKSEFCV